MNFKILTTENFDQEIKKLVKKFPSLKNEFAELVEALEKNPTLGKSLGKNCYKIRLSVSSKGKGKSAGTRVITYVIVSDTTVYLISIYDKSQKDSITDKELKNLLKDL